MEVFFCEVCGVVQGSGSMCLSQEEKSVSIKGKRCHGRPVEDVKEELRVYRIDAGKKNIL